MRKKGAAFREALGEDSMPAPAAAAPAVAAGKRKPDAEASAQLVAGFTPVPRKYRYDGWTPERQKAFIQALADTGSVTRAAGMVNMAQANCYTLRRSPGAEEFRRAWDAALDFGVKRLKDVAFERAVEGQLVPVFQSGKLIGFRRVYNDKLLIFCLRHYGQDANGKRTTINYFSSRATSTSSGQASAGAVGAGAGASPLPPSAVPLAREAAGGIAEASATTVRTVITGSGGTGSSGDAAAGLVNGFEGVALDAEAQAAIQAALEDCAARAREARTAGDEGGEAAADAAEARGESFFRSDDPYRALVPAFRMEEFVPVSPGEAHWSDAGAEMPAELVRIEEEIAKKGNGGAAAG